VGDIVVRCLRKGTPVRTGLRTEWVLLHSIPRVGVPLHCPACGELHKWFPQDAWIVPGLEPAADPSDLRAPQSSSPTISPSTNGQAPSQTPK
jgi:hypothetical protein